MLAVNSQTKMLNSLSKESHLVDKNYSFSMVYQPKIALTDGRVIGAEAIVNPQKPSVLPDVGLNPNTSPQISHVINVVLEDLSILIKAGFPISMAVNVSSADLANPGFYAMIRANLEKHGVPAKLLELEVTESSLLSEVEITRAQLMSLRAHGVKISIDGFNDGNATLFSMSKLPLSFLKIDASLIKNLIFSQSATAVVQSIIDTAKKLSLGVVAEGVENRATLNKLISMKCEMAQGFFLSSPRPIAALSTFIKLASLAKAASHSA